MSIVHRTTVLPSGVTLQITHGDLTQEPVDAIVNAANHNLAHGGGIAGAIVKAGGPTIQSESDAWVRQHGPVSHSAPAWTSAGRLPCRWVIHAVGPVWGSGSEDEKLAAAVIGSLRVADRLQAASVGLPAISTGIYGFPIQRAARIILQSIAACLDAEPLQCLREIRVVLWDLETLNQFITEFDRRWPA